MSSTHTCPVCEADYNIKTVHRCSKKKKAITPTIAALKAALKAALESERDDEMTAYELCTGPVGYRNGHQAATERLMGLLEKAVEMATDIERGFETDVYGSEWQIDKDDMRQKAREFLLSIRETVADASTLADASGEVNKEDK